MMQASTVDSQLDGIKATGVVPEMPLKILPKAEGK